MGGKVAAQRNISELDLQTLCPSHSFQMGFQGRLGAMGQAKLIQQPKV